MSRSKNRKIADLISGGTFDDGVVAASEVTGLATVATSGSFSDLSNQPTPFDPSTLATVATTGAYSALSGTPTLGTASTQATGAFATAAQGTTADAALPKAGGTFTGAVNFTVDSNFTDGDKLTFGNSNDLQIYHDGSNSYVSDQGTGDLVIQGGANIIFEKTGGEDMLTMANDGSVVIKYNGVDRIETTSSGIDVTGTVNADALTGIGSIDATTKNAIVAGGVGGLTEASYSSSATSAYPTGSTSGNPAVGSMGYAAQGSSFNGTPSSAPTSGALRASYTLPNDTAGFLQITFDGNKFIEVFRAGYYSSYGVLYMYNGIKGSWTCLHALNPRNSQYGHTNNIREPNVFKTVIPYQNHGNGAAVVYVAANNSGWQQQGGVLTLDNLVKVEYFYHNI